MAIRNRVWNQRVKTKPPVFINEDLPKETLRVHAELRKKKRELARSKIMTNINYHKYQVLTATMTYQVMPNYSFNEIEATNVIKPIPFLARQI